MRGAAETDFRFVEPKVRAFRTSSRSSKWVGFRVAPPLGRDRTGVSDDTTRKSTIPRPSGLRRTHRGLRSTRRAAPRPRAAPDVRTAPAATGPCPSCGAVPEVPGPRPVDAPGLHPRPLAAVSVCRGCARRVGLCPGHRGRARCAGAAPVVLGCARCTGRALRTGLDRRVGAVPLVPGLVCSELCAREAFHGAEEGRVVEAAVALGAQGGDELGDHGAHRQRGADRAGGVRDDAQVLVVQVDAEARLEVAVQEVVLLPRQYGRSWRARRPGRRARPSGPRRTSPGKPRPRRTPGCSRRRSAGSRPSRSGRSLCGPQSTMVLPSASKSGSASSKSACSPPTMIDSTASIAPASPPDTGASRTRIPFAAAAFARSMEVCGVIDDMSISSAPDLAFSRMPSGPYAMAFSTCGGGHHRDHHVGVPHGLGDRAGGRTARGGEALQLVLLQREPGDVVPGLDQVLRHGGAHDAETDPGDRRTGLGRRREESARVLLMRVPL